MAFESVREKYGIFSRERLLAPAIELAERGYELGSGDVAHIERREEVLAKDTEAARIFLVGGRAPKVGTILRQPDLAATLRQISAMGADVFYRGSIADVIVAASASHGGILQKA